MARTTQSTISTLISFPVRRRGLGLAVLTAIIVNTCIGVGVDYWIHFVSGYMFLRYAGESATVAPDRTVRNNGTLIVLNPPAAGAGFPALTRSDFPPVRDFWIVAFLAMVISAAFALVLLPAQFRFAGERTGRRKKKTDAAQ